MSHLYIECLCPSALVLTWVLVPAKAYKALNSAGTHTPHPQIVKLESLLLVEYRIYRDPHCLVINTLAGAEAPSTVASAFCSAKKGTTLIPPQGGTLLPHDFH